MCEQFVMKPKKIDPGSYVVYKQIFMWRTRGVFAGKSKRVWRLHAPESLSFIPWHMKLKFMFRLMLKELFYTVSFKEKGLIWTIVSHTQIYILYSLKCTL